MMLFYKTINRFAVFNQSFVLVFLKTYLIIDTSINYKID